MSSKSDAGRNLFAQESSYMRMIAAIIVAATLAFVIFAIGASQTQDDAFAAIYPVSEQTADDEADDQGSEDAAVPDKAAGTSQASEEGESIDDDANPMSSGLGGGEPISSTRGIGVEWFIGLGILAVVVFFAVSTRRLNSNIDKMRHAIGTKK